MADKQSMKSIAAALKPWTDLRGEQPRLSTEVIEHLFAKFVAIFGTKLADQWAGTDLEKVKATWAEALSELERAEIVLGIQAMVRSGKPFPPTLPEFYAFCRPPIDVPPSTDHAALDALGRRLGVSSANCPSYSAFRSRIVEAIADGRALPKLRALADHSEQ